MKCASGPLQSGTQQGYGKASSFTNGWVPRVPAADLGHRGSPSFEAQAERIGGALNAPPGQPPLDVSANGMGLSRISQQLLVPNTQDEVTPTLPIHQPNPENPLPPRGPVLKLLRLSQTKKQRFFVDVFVLDEQELNALCREVFFPINPYTLYTWSIVNVGLFYLFSDLKAVSFDDIGVNGNEVDEITALLAANAQDAVDSFRVCSEPSIEACQALALLVSSSRDNTFLFTRPNCNREHSASNPAKSLRPGLSFPPPRGCASISASIDYRL